MSFWYSDPADDRPQSIATGEAPLFEILTAAREQMRLVENSTAAGAALTRAYDQRIRDIEAATGETYQNPMQVDLQTQAFEQKRNPTYSFETGNETREAKISGAIDGFNRWLADVAQRHPDKAAAIGADRPVERDAEALARHADERLAKAMASRDGIGKWAAMLAGGVAGAGYDPLQVASIFAGGGPGAARTIGGRILAVTAKEAAVNALAEAVQQPQVQAWRKQAGLPNGIEEAARNVAFAGLLGGALGGAGQGVAEGVAKGAQRFWRVADLDTDAAARALADAPEASPALKAAIDGDARAAADLLRPIRDTLPAEARGAIDALEAARLADDIRPPAASARVHDDAMVAAMRAAQRAEIFTHEPDPAQVSRIVDQLVPETAAATKKTGGATAGGNVQEASLAEFLMRSGGVKDWKGELDAIGATKVRQRFVGSLVREDGMPLDQARLRAAEAGYFDRLYGTPDEAAEKSTIADLIDALDEGSRENTRLRLEDDGGRAFAEELVHELAARAGPAVDDRLILQAAELANAERIAPAEALDRVLIADDAVRFLSPEERALKEGGYNIDGMDTAELRRVLANVSDEAEAMIYTVQDLARLREHRDALAALKSTKEKGFDGSKVLEASTPDGTYMGRGKLADDMRAKGHEGFTVNERADMLREMDAEIASLEATVASGRPSQERLDIVQQARSVRRPNPADTRGGLDDPLGFPDEAAFSRADLEDLPEDMDIPFFDDEPPIGRDALIEHLDNLDHLTAVVEACRA